MLFQIHITFIAPQNNFGDFFCSMEEIKGYEITWGVNKGWLNLFLSPKHTVLFSFDLGQNKEQPRTY